MQYMHLRILDNIGRGKELARVVAIHIREIQACLKRQLPKRPKIGLQDQLSLNAGQNYCRMLQGEHCAMLSTSIKLPFSIKTLVLSIKWPL